MTLIGVALATFVMVLMIAGFWVGLVCIVGAFKQRGHSNAHRIQELETRVRQLENEHAP